MAGQSHQGRVALQVTTADTIYCGELTRGDDGILTVKLEGESQPKIMKYDDVQNVAIVESCTAPRAPR